MFNSIIEPRGIVTFPLFTGERVYMREFTKKKGLPSKLARWQETVDQMLVGVETDGPIYIMIDQTKVKKKNPHRRPGVHIDGYWSPGGHRGSGHLPVPQRHTHIPRHNGGGGHQRMGWQDATFEEPEGLILASNIPGCLGYRGEFEGPIKEGGDCSELDLSGLDVFSMRPNIVYAGNVTALHESIPVDQDCERTLVRLNVPGWSPEIQYFN